MRYFQHWNFVRTPATDLETKVSNLQLEEYKGIFPQKEGNSVMLHFDLFGKRDSTPILRTQ